MRTFARVGASTMAVAAVVIGGVANPAASDPGDRTIVAGTGDPGYSGDFGAATAAQLRSAAAIEVLPNGSFVIADEDDHRVRVVSPAAGGGAVIRTLAGTGTQGYSGDHDLSNAAQLRRPRGIAIGPDGSIYVADAGNQRVRKIAPDGVITTVVGTGAAGDAGDGGPARLAQVSSIDGLAVDAAGNLYVADAGNHRVRKVAAATGVITTVAGTGVVGHTDANMPAVRARLARPSDVDVDDAGNLYIADETAKRVVKVGPDGILRTIAGDGTDGTIAWRMALETGLARPNAVEVDASGDSVLIGTDEGVYAVAGVGRIARASYWGEDAPDIPNGDAVEAIALRANGDVLVGVGATVQRVERPVGTISGVVQTEVEGAFLPVADVRVELLDVARQPVAETTTNTRGRYTIPAPVGQWNLRYTRPGFETFDFLGEDGPLHSGVRVPLGGSVTLANPFLDYLRGGGTALYGRVTSETGEHPDTDVVLTECGQGCHVAPPAAQDDAGRFLYVDLGTAAGGPLDYSLQVVPSAPWAAGSWTPTGGFHGLGDVDLPRFTITSADVHASVVVPRDQIAISGDVVDNFGNAVISGTVEALDPGTGEIVGSSPIGEGTPGYRILFRAPWPQQVALRFVPAWDDDTHLPAWLGGTDEMTPASIVALGPTNPLADDLDIQIDIPTPPYTDGPGDG